MANYSKGAGNKVKEAVHEMKEGKLTSGRSGKKVTSRKQAIAIGLSEAKERGEKVPAKKSAAKGRSAGSKTAVKRGASKAGSKTAAKKGATKRGLASASTTTKKAVARKGGSASKRSS